MNGILKFIVVLSLFSACSAKEAVQEIQISDSALVVIGAKNWSGSGDCSAKVKIYRTDQGIGVHIEVKDDCLVQDPAKPSLSDGVELYFDFRPVRKRSINSFMKGVMQIVVRPGFVTRKDGIIFYPESYNCYVPGNIITTRWDKTQYEVDVFLPYKGLQEVHYLPRSSFGFDVALIDVDSAGQLSKMFWHAKNDFNWRYPANFGIVKWNKDE